MYMSAQGQVNGTQVDYQVTQTVYSSLNSVINGRTFYFRVFERGESEKVNYYSADGANINVSSGLGGGFSVGKVQYIGGTNQQTFNFPIVGWEVVDVADGKTGGAGATGATGVGLAGATGPTGPSGGGGGGTLPIRLNRGYMGYRAAIPDFTTNGGVYAVQATNPQFASFALTNGGNGQFQTYDMSQGSAASFLTGDMSMAIYIGNASPAQDLTGGKIRMSCMSFIKDQVISFGNTINLKVAVQKFDKNATSLGINTVSPVADVMQLDSNSQFIANGTSGNGACQWNFILESDPINLTKFEMLMVGVAYEGKTSGGGGFGLNVGTGPWNFTYQMDYVYT